MNGIISPESVYAQNTETAAVAALTEQAGRRPEVREVNGKQVLLLPMDWKTEQLADRDVLERPRQHRGTMQVADVSSLVTELRRWPEAPTVVMASRMALSLTAVLNPGTEQHGPGWGDHQVQVKVATSRELNAWLTAAKMGALSHQQLADFLEEVKGIVEPPRGDVLSLVGEFRMAETGGGSSKFNSRTGEYTVAWEGGQKHETELPSRIRVVVPAFEYEGYEVALEVRIRPALKEKQLTFTVLVDSKWQDEVDSAWTELVDAFRQNERLPAGVWERVLNV